jgi:phenylacetate-CoA ligase
MQALVPRRLALLRFIHRCESWDAERIREHQEAKLRALIQYCWKYVPYYGAAWRKHISSPDDIRRLEDLQQLPVLTKDELRDNLKGLTTTASFVRSMPARSGGSTGRPSVFRMTRHDEEMAWAQMYTAWNWAGWRVGDPFLAVGGESVGVGLGDNRTWKDWIVNRWVSSGSNLTLERTKKLAASPHFHRYRFLYGYPSAIRELCDLLNVIGDRPRSLKGVVCTAEVMRPEVRKDISRYLGGVPVHDQYGMNDGGLFAAERAEGAGLYVFFVRSVLEIVDDSGRQITEMERSGRALATCLTNYATPFVRYETGDQLHWHSPDTPASGIRWPRIGQVDGRTGDVIYLTSGRRIAMPGLTLVMRWIEGLRQYQFIQFGPNSVTVRLERGADFALSETEVVNYLRTKISDEIDWKIVWGGPELTQNQKVLIIRNDWLRSQGLRRPPMTTPA